MFTLRVSHCSTSSGRELRKKRSLKKDWTNKTKTQGFFTNSNTDILVVSAFQIFYCTSLPLFSSSAPWVPPPACERSPPADLTVQRFWVRTKKKKGRWKWNNCGGKKTQAITWGSSYACFLIFGRGWGEQKQAGSRLDHWYRWCKNGLG